MAVKTATVVDPFDSGRSRHAAGVFGMWLFLVTLGVLFAATILGYLVVRLNPDPAEPFVPADAPPLPRLLLLSTGVLLLGSGALHAMVRALRAGDAARAATMAGAALLLGASFLGMQAWAWVDLWRGQLRVQAGQHIEAPGVQVVLHAAHVIGGLPPLAVVWWRARRGRYSAGHPEGAVYCAMYWHFLDAVWIALYATLWLGSLTW